VRICHFRRPKKKDYFRDYFRETQNTFFSVLSEITEIIAYKSVLNIREIIDSTRILIEYSIKFSERIALLRT